MAVRIQDRLKFLAFQIEAFQRRAGVGIFYLNRKKTPLFPKFQETPPQAIRPFPREIIPLTPDGRKRREEFHRTWASSDSRVKALLTIKTYRDFHHSQEALAKANLQRSENKPL